MKIYSLEKVVSKPIILGYFSRWGIAKSYLIEFIKRDPSNEFRWLMDYRDYKRTSKLGIHFKESRFTVTHSQKWIAEYYIREWEIPTEKSSEDKILIKKEDLKELISGRKKYIRINRGNMEWDCKACKSRQGNSCYNGSMLGDDPHVNSCWPIRMGMVYIFEHDKNCENCNNMENGWCQYSANYECPFLEYWEEIPKRELITDPEFLAKHQIICHSCGFAYHWNGSQWECPRGNKMNFYHDKENRIIYEGDDVYIRYEKEE